jgi:hypothetical protein
MKRSGLQRKTELKAKTGLKSYKPLQAKTGLKTTRSLRDSYAAKIKAGEKTVKKSSKMYSPKYKYFSILTDDLTMCYISGSSKEQGAEIHIHHIFNAANKANSEKYGFIVPLRADWHDMASYGIHFDRELDLRMRRKCQNYWLEHYGTQEEFISVFGKWW